MWYTFLFFVIGLVGITFIIVDSKIADGFRCWWQDKMTVRLFGHELGEIVDCHQCTGFWIGVLGFFTLVPWIPDPITTWDLLRIPFFVALSGGAVSILSWLTRAVIDWLQMNMNITLDDLDYNGEETTKPVGDQTGNTD